MIFKCAIIQLIRLQRREQKKRRSQIQSQQKPNELNGKQLSDAEKASLLVATAAEKRKNPFAK